MSERPETLFEKWINGRFEAKMVISVTQRNQHKNPRISIIRGRTYSTKLGNAMSIQLGPNDLAEHITSLNDIQNKFFIEKSPD